MTGLQRSLSWQQLREGGAGWELGLSSSSDTGSIGYGLAPQFPQAQVPHHLSEGGNPQGHSILEFLLGTVGGDRREGIVGNGSHHGAEVSVISRPSSSQTWEQRTAGSAWP